ncbi:beta-1 adrenergic receptor-like [Amphibalanus amphitrite]|uniref:beta-1 adrenergic receptor-like n=1 Tax=Amphibalanus amphitrite TaxID=1232801 RepID=UPI001C8FB78C|nr:beta-1 adrenergic receptor-like [Amphibalanus amphitrite]
MPAAHLLHAVIDGVVVLLFLLVFLVATVANTLILAVLYRRPSLRSTSNSLICSLSGTNLLSVSVLLPLVVIDTAKPELLHDDVCRPMDAVAMFVITSSVIATVIIAVDKFCAIEEPLRYHSVMTPGRAALLAGVGWTASLASAAASTIGELRTRGWAVCQPREQAADPHDHSDEFRDNRSWTSRRQLVIIVQTAVVFFLPLVLLTWIYFCISRAARRSSARARSCAQLPHRPPPEAPQGEELPPPEQDPVTSCLRRVLSRLVALWNSEEARAVKVSVMVVVLFACCYVPFFAIELVRVSLARSLPPVYTHVSLIFVVSNAALAPFLYSLRSQTMQAEVRRLFLGRLADNRRSDAAGRRARARSTQSASVTPSGDGEEPPEPPGTPRTRFNVLGHPTYIRDSSMDSDSSGMTGVTAISVESTELEVAPIHRV